MDFTTQIKMMQAARSLNDSQTAELFGTTRQNYSRKIKNRHANILQPRKTFTHPSLKIL